VTSFCRAQGGGGKGEKALVLFSLTSAEVLSIPESKYAERKEGKREIKPEERYQREREGRGSRFCGVVEGDP